MTRLITYTEARDKLSWAGAVEALRQGHLAARAEIDDTFLGPADKTLLNRSCFIPGIGYGAKAVTVFDDNAARGLDTVQGAMLYFAPDDGRLQAIIESRLVTEIKTAGDSVLGARLLARRESRHLLVCGAGNVAASLIDAYTALFPGLERISLWNRTHDKARALAGACEARGLNVVAVSDLEATARSADIIASATMAREPLLWGEWIAPGTHVDLIGAFKADMREADDTLLQKARLFVDSRETTLGHIGELKIPIASGAIAEHDILGDFYDLLSGCGGRQNDTDITLFKNGGGAHLDLMTARYIADTIR
ncbi:ornithine cyclodeaminase family protein [Salinicola acroporae]|uniref:Ornithine cyclodeaminase n=1 Tax=Salinicola acroporae TaxID=1541440 RepID=A0ABT6I8V2_9GAMM|nr:ornithine cyclodeaminase [Salinicola acroporae]MDH4573968.1 ornithine cyclodeaminase [Salinicola acroporae]